MQAFENRFVIVLLCILAALSSFGAYLIQKQDANNKNYGHYPDAMAFEIRLINYDQSGFLTQITDSTQAFHYLDTKTTDFTSVRIQAFNQQNNPPWLITAPSATADNKGMVIKMHGLVTMQQTAYLDHFATNINTHDVTVFTDKKYLSTDAPVQLVQTGLQINAIGALYDYDHQILNLLNQVHSLYQSTLRKQS